MPPKRAIVTTSNNGWLFNSQDFRLKNGLVTTPNIISYITHPNVSPTSREAAAAEEIHMDVSPKAQEIAHTNAQSWMLFLSESSGRSPQEENSTTTLDSLGKVRTASPS